jgi:hypothetical protein
MFDSRLENIVLGAFAKLRTVTFSFVMFVCLSVRPRRTSRLPLEGMSSSIWVFFENLLRKLKFHQNLTRIYILIISP